jgi:hypothetical protein
MTAIVLPDIDFDELKKNLPSLADVELPSLERAGKHADETIDRLRGRNQGPSWAWIAAGIFTLGLIGTLVALATWSRRTGTLGDELDAEPPMAGSVTTYETTEAMPA